MTASLLSLSDELIVRIAQITSDGYYSSIKPTSSPPCTCGHCRPNLKSIPSKVPPSSDSTTFPLPSPLKALSLACKRFHTLLSPLLYQEVTLKSRTSVEHFARTLIDHPERGLEVRELSSQGAGDCGTVSAFFTEWLTLFVLGKCLELETVTFEDVRDGQEISHMSCWPVALQVLSGALPFLDVLLMSFTERSSLLGINTLKSIRLNRCSEIDFRGSLPLSDITHLALRDFTSIRHLKTYHLPSLKQLHLEKLEGLIIPEDLPIPSLQHATDVTLAGKVHALAILRVLESFNKLESLSISVNDAKVKLNLPPNSLQELPQISPPPHLKLIHIKLKLDNFLITCIPMLTVFEEILCRSGSPKVLLDLELNKRMIVGVEHLEAGIAEGARKILRSARHLEISIVWTTTSMTNLELQHMREEEEEEWDLIDEDGESLSLAT